MDTHPHFAPNKGLAIHRHTPPSLSMTMLTFAVHRGQPMLVGPAVPTPHETKRLSDTDDQEVLRMHVPFLFFSRGGTNGRDHDPTSVIRRALGEALVPYYPFAGRVREVEERKLLVDCTGEGVLFVEADADVRLAELEAARLRPPFPCMDQLLFDVEGSSGVLNCPLLLVQVTRLLCGGFVLAIRLNHTISDATGLEHFLSAVAGHAHGLPAPAVGMHKWSRELLEARSPPKPSFPHREFDAVPMTLPPPGEMVMRTFNFRAADITAIKKHLPPRIRDTTTKFEALTAAIWRGRTAAMELLPDEEIRLVVIVNLRKKLPDLVLPAGYYGNACAFPTVVTTAGALLAGSLADAVEIVQNVKATVTAEYVRSMLDFLVLRGRPCLALANLYVVSDVRHTGFHRLDFEWGEPVFGGPADIPFTASYFISIENDGGEDIVAVPVMLPRTAMDHFTSEIQVLLKC